MGQLAGDVLWTFEMNDNFLVLGSNSFSGSHFCRFLLEKEYEVTGLSRSTLLAEVFAPWFHDTKNSSRFSFYEIDLNENITDFKKILKEKNINVVVNFAAQSMVGQSWSKPMDWVNTNISSMLEIIQILKKLYKPLYNK